MRNWLDLGNYNAICDSCGRKFKASQLRKRWDGLMVCNEDYETRHPSDFLRVQREQTSVPWSRPEVTDTFITGEPLLTESSMTVPPYTNTEYILAENLTPLFTET